MNTGSTAQLRTTVKPAQALKSVSYKSSSSKVAKVDKKGNITALKKGMTKITITLKAKNGKKQSTWVKVKVNGTDTSKIQSYAVTNEEKNASKKTLKLEKGKTTALKVAIQPASARKSVSYKTSNKKIATVDKNGKVKAVKGKKGTVTITARATDGSGKKATIKIRVK